MGAMEELKHSISKVSVALETLQATQSCHGLILEELRSILLERKELRAPIRALPQLPGQPEDRPRVKRTASSLAQVAEEFHKDLLPVPNIEEVSRVKPKNRSGKASTSLGLMPPRPSGNPAALSMEDLETLTARELLMGRTNRSPMDSLENEEEEEEDVLNLEPSTLQKSMTAPLDSVSKEVTQVRVSEPKVNTITLGRLSSTDRNEILRHAHYNLEVLQDKHDAKARALKHRSTLSRSLSIQAMEDCGNPMPCVAQVGLASLGVLDIKYLALRLFRAVWISSLLLGLLAACGYLIWHSMGARVDAIDVITTCCYLLGVVCGLWSFRHAGVQDLLGTNDYSLEVYARMSGFLGHWKAASHRRCWEVFGFLALMLACRWLGHLAPSSTLEKLQSGVFTAAALGFAAIAYTQLHIVAGLELAIDSFTVHFFKAMDASLAMPEWNVVQATLRQVSMRLSGSVLFLGCSCGVSLLVLVDLAWLRNEERALSNEKLLQFIAGVVPSMLLFLYVLLRAAAVTEKASRVAPLVNSWTFKKGSTASQAPWMDSARQYMVQYIVQSEAGFYLQGKRLYTFQVTKVCYYLGAFSMALLSRVV